MLEWCHGWDLDWIQTNSVNCCPYSWNLHIRELFDVDKKTETRILFIYKWIHSFKNMNIKHTSLFLKLSLKILACTSKQTSLFTKNLPIWISHPLYIFSSIICTSVFVSVFCFVFIYIRILHGTQSLLPPPKIGYGKLPLW